MTRSPSHLSAVPDLALDGSMFAVTVPARAMEASGIRRAIGRLGRQAGLGPERLSDLGLAVGEACANVVVHAYVGREPGILHASATITPEGLVVVIADEGRGLAPRDDSPGLGLGLPLIASLATTLEFRTGPHGGTELRMLFATPEAAADGAADWLRTG